MKQFYIFLVIVFVLLFTKTNSQDFLTPPVLRNVDTTRMINRNLPNFIRGWNWGATDSVFDASMFINFYHCPDIWSTNIHNMRNTQIVFQLGGGVIGGGNSDVVFNARSLYLEPTIIVDPTDNFKPRFGDTTGAVFGFLNRNFTVGDTVSSGIDFDRFKLYESNLTNGPELVLDSIWNGGIIRWLDYNGNDIGWTNHITENSDSDKVIFHPFNGKQWYLTINLRALNMDSVENHLNDTILIIRIPYKISYYEQIDSVDYGYVKFDSIPEQSFNQNDSIKGSINNHFRGYYRNLRRDSTQTTEFAITGEMLKLSDANHTSITLSAFAFFDGTIDEVTGNYNNNPRFKNDWWENRYQMNAHISSIDVEVTYWGNLDVGIDYIRLETLRARKVFWGVYDDTVRQALDWVINDLNHNQDSLRIYRFYGNDEMVPSEWGAVRYFNMLIDTLASVESYAYMPLTPIPYSSPYYLHATGFQEFWNGSNINFGGTVAMPYTKHGSEINPGLRGETFNYLWGWAGKINVIDSTKSRFFWDTLNSKYDTFLWGYDTIPPLEDPLVYERFYGDQLYNYEYGPMFQAERRIYNNYYKNKKLIFNEKPWWANLWVQSEDWICDTTDNSLPFTLKNGTGDRPKTGEEVRWMMNMPIILGTKGILYWQKTTIHYNDDTLHIYNDTTKLPRFLGLKSARVQSQLQGKELVYSDSIGGDYINVNNDPNGFHKWYDSSYYDFETMGIDENHIYIGLKSVRAEIMKHNMWIAAVEDTLLDLRLAAWYGKGFLTWCEEDPIFPIGLTCKLNEYTDIDHIKTRKIWDELNQTWDAQPDSSNNSFFDITLLRHSNDTNLTSNVVFFGIQNRRTDPLIRTLIMPDSTIDSNMKFYSTAELERLCGISPDTTNSADSLWWRSFWWKRLGCRELQIPFPYSTDSRVYNGYYFIVQELGYDSDTLNNQRWREPQFYHMIDTVLKDDETLIAKLLPGQGKILRMEIGSIAGNQDTACSGCQHITENIGVEVGDRTCNDGIYCWNIKIKNDSLCYYDSLNLALEYTTDNPDTLSITSNPVWDASTVNQGENNYYLMNGDLFDGDSLMINICTPANNNLNMNFRIGTVVNGRFIACDSILNSINNIAICDQINFVAGMDSCACNECSYMLNSPPIDTCIADSWQMTFKGEGIDSTVNGNGFNQGAISMSLCIRDGIDSVIVELMKDSSIVCSKEFVVDCNKCDSIKVQFLSRIIGRCTNEGIEVDRLNYGIYLDGLSPCIYSYDLVDITHNYTWISNVQTNGEDSLISSFADPYFFMTGYDLDYEYRFKDSLGNILCTKTLHFKAPTNGTLQLQVNKFTDTIFCCGDIYVKSRGNDTPVYGITVHIPDSLYTNIYSNFLDPSVDPPFDFSGNGLYLTTHCVPTDSPLQLNVRLYDSTNNLVDYFCYDSICSVSPLKSIMYIGNFNAHPNPANKLITFDYELLQSAYVKLELYDHMGHLVDKIFSEKQEKGFYKREYYTYELKEGLYYAVLWAENEYKTIGIIIMH